MDDPLAPGLHVVATPIGGWIQSWFFGTGVRWANAYTALDTAEANLPSNVQERDRMLKVVAEYEQLALAAAQRELPKPSMGSPKGKTAR